MRKVELNQLDWSQLKVRQREKNIKFGEKNIRIVEFSYGFIEEDWCTKGHIGIVLNGSLAIDFNGQLVDYSKGDCILIQQGFEDRHKVIMSPGQSAQLLLLED